jgi:hypothetical protein
MLGIGALPGQQGKSLRPYLEGKKSPGRTHITSQYLENEETFLSSPDWKFIHCSGRRKRTDGYETERPTPGRYIRLYDRKRDPGEFTDVAAKYPEVVARMQGLVLERYRATHPDAAGEPKNLPAPEAIDFYVRPRDA